MSGKDSLCCFHSGNCANITRLFFELNTTCNLNCDFCHTVGEVQTQGLSAHDIFYRLRELADRNVSEFIFSGGEPLLRKDLLDILRFARSLGLKLDLCTNGTLIDREHAYSLSEFLSEISVSVDASDARVHDRIRRQDGAHKKTLEGITYLRDAGLEVHVISMVDVRTIPYLEETARQMENMGVHSLSFIGRMQVDDPDSLPLWLTNADKIGDIIQKIRAERSIQINTKRLLFSPSDFVCPAGDTFLSIDARGADLPCILMKRLDAKSIDSWKKSFQIDRERKCKKCQYYEICTGGCPGAQAIYSGTVGIDPLCPYAK